MPAYLECVPVWVRRLRSSLLVGLCLGLLIATVPAPRVHSQSPCTSYVPLFCQPESNRLSLPLFIGEERTAPANTASAARLSPDQTQQTPTGLGWVTRSGEDLSVGGRPYVFVGTNASFLAGPFFPESKMVEVMSQLAGLGVMVVRVWVEPWCDLTRLARLLDLGGQCGIRFIVTLQDFYGQKDAAWFRGRYETVDLPHIRRIVPLFADRPEILMWELMNEPLCPDGDAGPDCWDALVHWADVTSTEIKRLDARHLVSAGTLDARFDSLARKAFRRISALPTVDVVSVHRRVGGLPHTELAIAHELGKPIFFGEVQLEGHDKSCQPLSGDALQSRAQAIAADLTQSLQAGVDGYLLWQYAYGPVDMGSHIQYFCGELDYFNNDPVWRLLQPR
ncbi:MAG TPA: hypothetical protein PKJ21_10590 [Anaerolineae bacterium]|nr:hypothetical protein [Anaerolineae bacterium]